MNNGYGYGIRNRRNKEGCTKDAHELTRIAIEDDISKTQVLNMFHPIKLGMVNHWSMEKILEEVKEYAYEENVVSEIIGRTILSRRYAEKILSIIPQYYRRPNDLNLLIRSTSILYSYQKQGTEKII
jgi:hypothetical protein